MPALGLEHARSSRPALHHRLRPHRERDLAVRFRLAEQALARNRNQPGGLAVSKGFRGPDEAQVVTDRATADTIHRILDEDAIQAEHARARIAEGGYGGCGDCSGKIATDRLEAPPDATRRVGWQAGWGKATRCP